MSTNMPVVLARETEQTATEGDVSTTGWIEATLTVTFTAAAVLFVSFVAVVTGLL